MHSPLAASEASPPVPPSPPVASDAALVASSGTASAATITPTPDQAAALAALEAAFREHVEALQNPADCAAAPLYLFVPHAFASGIGSQLRILANSMVQAVVAQRTFVLDDRVAHSTFVDPRRCDPPGYGCLFAPPSRCALRDAGLGAVEADTKGLRYGLGGGGAEVAREPLPAAVGHLVGCVLPPASSPPA